MKSYPLPRKFETTEESSYRYVHYGDIHTGIANIINNVEDLPKIVNGKYETLDKGDLILADASEDYQGIAWPAILNVDPQENVLAGLHTIALRPNPNIDSMFLYYTFLNTDFRKFGYRMGTGMKVFGISKKNLYKYNLSKPINIEEQERISSLLIKLNNIITLEQEKLMYYKEIKLLLLLHIFNSEQDSNYLRFNSTKNKWFKIKLEDLYSLGGSGGTPRATNKEYYENGTIPFLGIADLTAQNGQIYNTEKSITQLGLENSSASIVPKGSITVSMYASYGKVGKFHIDAATSQAFFNMSFDDELTADYTYYYLEYMEKTNRCVNVK